MLEVVGADVTDKTGNDHLGIIEFPVPEVELSYFGIAICGKKENQQINRKHVLASTMFMFSGSISRVYLLFYILSGECCKSEKIKDMQKRIEGIKSSEEVGVRYMQAWEEKALERQKGREDTTIKVCEKCNLSKEDLCPNKSFGNACQHPFIMNSMCSEL